MGEIGEGREGTTKLGRGKREKKVLYHLIKNKGAETPISSSRFLDTDVRESDIGVGVVNFVTKGCS